MAAGFSAAGCSGEGCWVGGASAGGGSLGGGSLGGGSVGGGVSAAGSHGSLVCWMVVESPVWDAAASSWHVGAVSKDTAVPDGIIASATTVARIERAVTRRTQ